MKKLTIALALISCLFIAFKPERKPLKVELPAEAWNTVLQVIEQSNAPHQQVKAVQEELLKQLNAQVDTAKKK